MSKEVENPFGTQVTGRDTVSETDSSRAIAEVQAAVAAAKNFPRDPVAATDRVLQSCTRQTLAEQAVYSYPRGGQTVTGPSIRLAEAIAQCWGNIQYGVRELITSSDGTVIEAYAHDVETNTRVSRTFRVAHKRSARGRTQTLSDPRDIYEMTANQGARRVRACILAVIPGDVIDAALRQCELTLANTATVDDDSVAKLVAAFGEVGVTAEQLSHRLGGKHLSAMSSAEMISLRRVYQTLRDGMAKPAQFFPERTPAQRLQDRQRTDIGDSSTVGDGDDEKA